MTLKIHFDDSLPCFAQIVYQRLGEAGLKDNFFLRDTSGKLTLIDRNSTINEIDREFLETEARKKLGKYVDAAIPIATPTELFDERLSDPQSVRIQRLDHPLFKGEVNVLDRRTIGADWLRETSQFIQSPPKFVFTSIKGGVGRSTALCVVAAHLASEGRRVLAVDMDLEAPGLGSMLLTNETLPKFGLLDYFVERNMTSIEQDFYIDLIGSSWLAGHRGRIDVIPALGTSSMENPENVLSKIGRAYLEGFDEDKSVVATFLDRMQELLDRVAPKEKYDVILIDSRAGLHETNATAFLGMSTEILLFGAHQPQTYYGYTLLLASLSLLPQSSKDTLKNRIRIVQSKATPAGSDREEFRDTMNSIIKKYLGAGQENEINLNLKDLATTFDVEWKTDLANEGDIEADEWDEIPTSHILSDSNFINFDPIRDSKLLSVDAYSQTFGKLVEAISDQVNSSISEILK